MEVAITVELGVEVGVGAWVLWVIVAVKVEVGAGVRVGVAGTAVSVVVGTAVGVGEWTAEAVVTAVGAGVPVDRAVEVATGGAAVWVGTGVSSWRCAHPPFMQLDCAVEQATHAQVLEQ